MNPPPPESPLLPYTTLFRSLQVRRVLQHLQGDRALTGHDVEVVERVDEHQVALLAQLHGEGRGLVVALAVDDHFGAMGAGDRKSTRLNSSHSQISYAVFCLK